MKPKNSRISDDPRLALLRDLLQRWPSFKGIPRRKMKMALSPEEWQIYDAESRPYSLPEPEAYLMRQINQYVELLRVADALQCRADNEKHSSRPRLRCWGYRTVQHRADIAYTHAWECLEEISGDTPGIALWFDRPLDLGQNSNTASDCAEGIPRPIWSRSQYTLRHGKPKLSQRKMAKAALEASYDRLLASNGSLERQLDAFHSDRLGVASMNGSGANSLGTNDLPLLQLNWWK